MIVRQVVGTPPERYAFEGIPETALSDTMGWKGTLATVYEEIETSYCDGPPVVQQYPWHPARIVRGVIESDIQGDDRRRLTEVATAFALRAYAGVIHEADIDAIRTAIADAGLADQEIRQKYDSTTIGSSTSLQSAKTAARLQEKVSDPALVVPVCHGGFLAGVQTALCRYEQGDRDIAVYPLRHSRRKAGDCSVRIQPPELEHIRNLAVDRAIVVHDEDAYSGATVEDLVWRLTREFPDTTVLGTVNHDSREGYLRQTQGEWWEVSARKARQVAMLYD
jgi:hypothetical protein